MRTILLVVSTIIIGGYFYTRMNISGKIAAAIRPQITIEDLKGSSQFVDSLVELQNLKVIETRSILKYTWSKVIDKTGQTMTLLSYRPFLVNEQIEIIKGRYSVVYTDNYKRCEVFISEELKAFHDLMNKIKHSMF